MSAQEYMNFREMLLDRRREIFERVRRLEGAWEELREPAIELEEEAQKASISEPYHQLDNNGKQLIEQIDLALAKMLVGDYGICEACGDDIGIKRLDALPWTRLCVDCAREYEKSNKRLPPPSDVIGAVRVPDEIEGLSSDQVLKSIYEQIQRDGRIDTEELEISFQDGILYLDGMLPSEQEHQILLMTLTDIMGFSDIVDHLEINKLMWEREDRAPGRRSNDGATPADRLFYDQEDLIEDRFEAGDEKPYSPPETPQPMQE